MMNNYKIKENITETRIPKSSTYTHARYKYYDSKGNVHYFTTRYISMIDVPYKNMNLYRRDNMAEFIPIIPNIYNKTTLSENRARFDSKLKISKTLSSYEEWYLKTFGRLPKYEP